VSMADLTADERAVRGTSSPVLGMVLFVASEAMFFAAFFGAYFTIYAAAPVWPPPNIPIPATVIPSIATGMLITSSFTLQAGVRAIRKGRTAALNRWLSLTILLGITFLVLQIYDYSQQGFGIHDGVYASLFYVMTGLHTAHVIGGVLFLSLIFAQSRTGQLSLERHEPVEAGAIYWHFVDVVWIGLFTAFYVLTQGGS
jgi:cytochrome c oxidase subunit III